VPGAAHGLLDLRFAIARSMVKLVAFWRAELLPLGAPASDTEQQLKSISL
jgi:hypothetical protein